MRRLTAVSGDGGAGLELAVAERCGAWWRRDLAEPALLETEEDTPAIEHKDEGEQLVRLHGGVVGVVGPGRGRAIQGYRSVHTFVTMRTARPFMEATDASRLVCVVVVSYQEYSLTHGRDVCECVCVLTHTGRDL